MLTVKYIDLEGQESIQEATEASLIYSENRWTNKHKSVCFKHENGVLTTIDTGTVYVMNRDGKTVAKYDLGNPYEMTEVKG